MSTSVKPVIGGGVDFDSDPVVATFQPNQDSTTVRIPLVCDTEIEGDERFNITLNASLPVILGARSTAIGVIEDSTGTYIIMVMNVLAYLRIRFFSQLLFLLEWQATVFLKMIHQLQ